MLKKKVTLIFLLLLLFALPFIVMSLLQRQDNKSSAATPITPTVYCVGGVGSYPCATLPPTSTTAPTLEASSAPITTNPTENVVPTNPEVTLSPTIDPCATESSNSVMTNKKHKKDSGGFFEMFFKFLIWLIQLLLNGGTLPPPPGPDVTPTPDPSIEPSPSLDPCPSPSGIPTTEPTSVPTLGPSIGLVSPTVSNQPTTAPNASLPAQLLNLANWKLQLPSGAEESPTEIKQPELATYKNDPFFMISTGGGVRFRAPVNGVTTSGSDYPRSELREMTSNGTAQASWSTTSGTHTMLLEEAITAVPMTKKHVVAGQIHDGENDVIVIRLEMPKLFVDIGGTDGPTLDANYTLGKRFTVKFEVTDGKTNIYYNGSTSPIYTMSTSYANAYFKAGAYTQSNCSTEATTNCNVDNYGEVVLYKAEVSHQ